MSISNQEFLLQSEMQIQNILDLPYAASNPAPYQQELLHDGAELIQQINLYCHDLEKQLTSSKLTKLAREKIKNVLRDYKTHLAIMSKNLAPLGLAKVSVAEHKIFSSRRKVGQRLIEYYGNIARDWAWGIQENLQGVSLLRKAAQKSNTDLASIKKILVIGAGACRLPYEVHRWIKPEHTVCVDYNPYLLTVAKKLIIDGEKLTHIDFPNVPLDVESFTVPYELSAPETLKDSEFSFLVHDLREWGFRHESVDLVLSPWIIDVVPVLPPRLFAQINSVLRPGGLWMNYGPLNFSRQRLVDNWTLQEVMNQVQRSGFEVSDHEYSQVPHLQNPHSAHGRLDYVLTFCAKKIEDCEIPQDPSADNLPDWIHDHHLPVEAPMALRELQASLRFSYELSTKLESQLTIAELAAFLSAQQKIPFDQAEYLVKNTLLGWISSNRFNPMKSLS